MLKLKPKQLSLYTILYSKIPEDHLLKGIDKAVDFSFINKMLEGSCSKHFGRPAKEPEMMAKLLILQYLYNLSDTKVIEETSLNLAYMWFVDINPEEDLPDPSLLAKFRTQRLKDTSIDDIRNRREIAGTVPASCCPSVTHSSYNVCTHNGSAELLPQCYFTCLLITTASNLLHSICFG